MRRQVALLAAALAASCPTWAAWAQEGTTAIGPTVRPPTTGLAVTSVTRKLYVATTGDDITGSGTAAAPWATIGKANSYIVARKLGRGRRVQVLVAPGDYTLTSTVTIARDGGGLGGGQVAYKCNGTAGTCRFHGASAVTGWSVYAGSISQKALGRTCPHTIYENGHRARMARTPNLVYSAFYPHAFAPYFGTQDPGSSHTLLQIDTANWDPATLGAGYLTDLRLFHFSEGFRAWYTDLIPATAYNGGTRRLTLDHGGTRLHTYFTSASRYFPQGNLAWLDQAGEFYCDSSTNTLYYWPVDGAIGSQTIMAPTANLVTLIEIAGSSASARAGRVVLDGLSLEDTDAFDWMRSGYAGSSLEIPTDEPGHVYPVYQVWRQMPAFRYGAVTLRHTNNVIIQNTHIKNAGHTGIFVDRQAESDTIRNSFIEHTGGFGIHFDGEYPGEGDMNRSSTVSDVIVQDFGELVGHANGIAITGSNGNTLSHVTVNSGPRDCIYLSAFTDLARADAYTHDNRIEYARVHDCAQDGGDVGAVGYAFFSSKAITSPFISNTMNQATIEGAYATTSMIDLAPNGLFTDEQTHGQVFSNVLIAATQGAAERENDSGDHVLTNVSWQGGFNVNLMDLANIGVRSTNPYLTAAKYTFSDGFEAASPFANWTAGIGTPTVSGAQVHSGSNSFIINEDGDLIYLVLPRRLYQQASVWFYDDATDVTMGVYARVDQTEYSGGFGAAATTWASPTWRGIGVDTSSSTTKYIYTDGGTSFVGSVTRTTGWHQFVFDFTSGTGVTFKVDGTTIGTLTGVRSFNKLSCGDPATNGIAGTVYFDDWSVS